MAQQIQVRRDTATNWTSANPTLAAGEIGFETNTGKFKIGDGSTAWASLSYFATGGGGTTNLAYTAGATNGVVTSDTGTDATIPLADGTNAGLMAPAQHTKLAGIESGATADMTAAEILAALLTVDGTGSGLDADLLDGQSSAAFLTVAAAASGYQPLDSDLTAIAALSTTSYGRALLTLSNLAALQAILGTGTPSSSTYLRGDGQWATPAGGGAVATDTIFDAKGDLPVGTGADTAAKLTVGANGTTVIADSNASTGLRYVGSPRTKAPRTVSQAGYYMPDTFSNVATVATQSAATAQEAYWFPFWLPRRATPTIAMQCFTLESGSTARLSTWSNDEATFKPATGGLLEDLGTVSGASTGTKELTCAVALNPGWVWVGVWCSNHTTVRWGRNAGSTAAVNHNIMGDAGVYSGRGVYGWYATGLDYSSAWNSTLPSLTAGDFASKFNPPTPYIHNL